MKQPNTPTLSFEDWKREKLKNIKFRAAYKVEIKLKAAITRS